MSRALAQGDRLEGSGGEAQDASMKILTELCSIPTAPFVEDRVVGYVERFVKARPRLRLRRDAHGNLLIELPGKTRSPRWVFTAHMDHPGFVADKMLDAKTLRAHFRGYVLADYVRGAKVRFFDGAREIRGRVIEVKTRKDREVPSQATVAVSGGVAPGSPGMFDVEAGRVRGGRFVSRVCDNLAGAAAALAMLDRLARNPPKSAVAVLLTRAEEEGFIGAIAACLQPKLLRKNDRLIVIECSAMQPFAPQSKGPIIRVGDRTSIFNSDLSHFITTLAGQLVKKRAGFQFQRALMSGGTCEATVYNVYGYTAAAICLALGNYHNMDRETKRIAPEYIDANDWNDMVRLFIHIARNAHTWQSGHKPLKERLERRFEEMRRRL